MEIVLAKLHPAEAKKAIHKFTMKTHGFSGFAGMYSGGIHTNPLTDRHGKKRRFQFDVRAEFSQSMTCTARLLHATPYS